MTWLRFGQASRSAPPVDAEPETLHALISPDAPIDLNRAQIGERLLLDAETKVLYWASRAGSVAYTAERTGYRTAEVINVLAGLQGEGFVRLQRLPAAMARLHVFWRTGEAHTYRWPSRRLVISPSSAFITLPIAFTSIMLMMAARLRLARRPN